MPGTDRQAVGKLHSDDELAKLIAEYDEIVGRDIHKDP